MHPTRHVTLFKPGRSQAVRIPREFKLPGAEAVMGKEGERLSIEPVPGPSLLAWLAMIAPLVEDLPEVEDVPPEPVEL